MRTVIGDVHDLNAYMLGGYWVVFGRVVDVATAEIFILALSQYSSKNIKGNCTKVLHPKVSGHAWAGIHRLEKGRISTLV